MIEANPTAAEMLNGVPQIRRATNLQAMPKGSTDMTASASRIELNET
jgi:hypothetical protein